MSDSDLVQYPFFMKIIKNLSNIIEPTEQDLDLSMLFIYLYWFSCKFLKINNIQLNHKNIYIIMESIFKNHETRKKLLNMFKNKTNFQLEQIHLQIEHIKEQL